MTAAKKPRAPRQEVGVPTYNLLQLSRVLGVSRNKLRTMDAHGAIDKKLYVRRTPTLLWDRSKVNNRLNELKLAYGQTPVEQHHTLPSPVQMLLPRDELRAQLQASQEARVQALPPMPAVPEGPVI